VPLIVYRSSAGSGKTTALVNEYLKITLQNPLEFRHILAITFTNKAAAEMKERILKALDEIIIGGPECLNQYVSLMKNAGLTANIIQQRAGQVQSLILHNYDDFSVSTIDSFVHRIIRTFATDVKLPQNFEVVIDKEDFVPEIVAELFDKIGNDQALTDIMVNFVMAQTENEKSYNIGYELNKFVEKQIGEEGFQQLQKIDQLTTADFAVIIQKLEKKLALISKEIKESANQALEVIRQNNLTMDDFFQGRRGIYAYFLKCSELSDDKALDVNTYVQDTINNDKWIKAKTDSSTIETINTIKGELIHFFNQIISNVKNYTYLKMIHQKIYSLALTHEIRSVFLDFTNRTQKVHISEFNKRINEAIAGQPVPFIYERLGRRYKYFLIDEFQDTSVLQWQNLLPLIEESLAYDNFNMLVGDAKQAIYRFRNGEVELFVNLPEIYNKDGSQEMIDREHMLKMNYHEIFLDKNWRSDPEIIRFNNEFFEELSKQTTEHIQHIYSGHNQKIPDTKSGKEGYVSIELIESENADEYSKLRLERIKSQVQKLIANGYRQEDICVLTRTNTCAIEVAACLIENKFNVVSSESLLLTNAPEVRLIIAFYNLLLYPGEKLFLAEWISNLVKTENFKDEFHAVYSRVSAVFPNGLDAVFSILKLELKLNEVAELPVYEIAEYLVRNLHLNHSDNIYLHYFLDFVFDAQQRGKGTLGDFIELWQLKKKNLFITMPEGGNAIRVMTVHKAKGLKFEAVITDLINRKSGSAKSDFYTDFNDPDFEDLKVVMLPISGRLEKIGMKAVYDREKEKTELDFINLVYVAFTRAVSALFINGNIKNDHKSADRFTAYLTHFLESKELLEAGKSAYEFGKMSLKKEAVDNKEDEVVLEKFISSSWSDQVRIAPAEEVYWEALDQKPARTYGNLIHGILAKIKYSDEVDQVIQSYNYAGIIDETEADEIKTLVNKVVFNKKLEPLYKKGVLVKNEVDVFEVDRESVSVQRPDRVVVTDGQLTIIDYKTGEKEDAHMRQMNRYAEFFENLGYKNVNKKLVYLNVGVEVVDVD